MFPTDSDAKEQTIPLSVKSYSVVEVLAHLSTLNVVIQTWCLFQDCGCFQFVLLTTGWLLSHPVQWLWITLSIISGKYTLRVRVRSPESEKKKKCNIWYFDYLSFTGQELPVRLLISHLFLHLTPRIHGFYQRNPGLFPPSSFLAVYLGRAFLQQGYLKRDRTSVQLCIEQKDAVKIAIGSLNVYIYR